MMVQTVTTQVGSYFIAKDVGTERYCYFQPANNGNSWNIYAKMYASEE